MKFLAPLLVLAALLFSIPVPAHDHDHPELDEWFAGLMQPDNPEYSCCGEADHYWCSDPYEKRNAGGAKAAFCRITDDRDDGPLKRAHIPLGTEIEIPTTKLKWDRGNPTGHNVIFLTSHHIVLCYVQGTGS